MVELQQCYDAFGEELYKARTSNTLATLHFDILMKRLDDIATELARDVVDPALQAAFNTLADSTQNWTANIGSFTELVDAYDNLLTAISTSSVWTVDSIWVADTRDALIANLRKVA